MKAWKNHYVRLTMVLLSISFPIFLVTGYTALYWAWPRGNYSAALPYLPWARNFGMLAIAGAASALTILFSSKTFPLSSLRRLWLSVLATASVGFFSEFRNDGKFYLKKSIHFFGPGTWIHDTLNHLVPSSGDFLYRNEYSHWNDFLLGPAAVSVLFSLVFVRLYRAVQGHGPIGLMGSTAGLSTDLDDALRFARILMNVGLFWFFLQAWAEKAGYLPNPHSNDEMDLPFEFAGTMLGFWMTRILTKPFNQRAEKFRSTLGIDLVSSGVIGVLYTLLVGPLTEGLSSNIAHSLSAVVPASLDLHEYTPFQQHMRPFELLLLAGAMWWGLNRSRRREHMADSESTPAEPESPSRLELLATMTVTKILGVTAGYLLFFAAAVSILELEGLGSTLGVAGAGMALGGAGILLVHRIRAGNLTTVFGHLRVPVTPLEQCGCGGR